jgi:hypothetical protein
LFVHLVLSAVAEASLLLAPQHHQAQLYKFVYNFSPLVTSNVVAASVLYLFVKPLAARDTSVYFATIAAVVTLLDFFVVKHADLTIIMTPSTTTLQQVNFFYGVAYFTMVHLNHYMSGHAWPYANVAGIGLFSRVTLLGAVYLLNSGVGYVLLFIRGGMHDYKGGSYSDIGIKPAPF